MESNFGGFTDKGQDEFIGALRDIFSYSLVKTRSGGLVANDLVSSKATCLVDEATIVAPDNSKRTACHIFNNGASTAYVRAFDYDDSNKNDPAYIIANGYPIPAGKELVLPRFSNLIFGTPASGTLDLRVMDIANDNGT